MKIAPLPQGFGARITEFDLRHGGATEDIKLLRQTFHEHHLLVFRSDGLLSAERQIEITGWFGPIAYENGNGWTVLDNAETSGRARLGFHSDIEFLQQPLLGLSLYPEELPQYKTSTTYISTVIAWRNLPETLQAELQDCTAIHHYRTFKGDFPDYKARHPVRMLDPGTGEPLLYISEMHVNQIEGLPDARNVKVIPELFDTLYASDRQYEHVWSSGDLLVWNNRAIQHARTEVAELSRGRRVMRRVQLGEIGFLAQVERLGLEPKIAR